MNLDQKIEQALRSENPFPDTSEEATVLEEIARAFTGKYKFFMTVAWIKMIGFVALLVFCAYQFYIVETTKAMLGWASLGIMSFVAIVTIQIFFWVFMNRTNTLRELKRLELQISILNSKIN